jgi:Starch-binding associating with outer membrane
MAEAKQRYPSATLPLTTQAYNEAGITEYFRAFGADVSKAAQLYGSTFNNAGWAASTDKLAAISIQKWTALTNFCGLEAWTEYRRTNLPFTPQRIQVTDNKRPLRFFYPNAESGSNTANVSAAGKLMYSQPNYSGMLINLLLI